MRIKQTEQIKEFRAKADVKGPTERKRDMSIGYYHTIIDGQSVKVKVMPAQRTSRRRASYFTRKGY